MSDPGDLAIGFYVITHVLAIACVAIERYRHAKGCECGKCKARRMPTAKALE
jgi:hypothetical protein